MPFNRNGIPGFFWTDLGVPRYRVQVPRPGTVPLCVRARQIARVTSYRSLNRFPLVDRLVFARQRAVILTREYGSGKIMPLEVQLEAMRLYWE
jgi:hypothetical protein